MELHFDLAGDVGALHNPTVDVHLPLGHFEGMWMIFGESGCGEDGVDGPKGSCWWLGGVDALLGERAAEVGARHGSGGVGKKLHMLC